MKELNIRNSAELLQVRSDTEIPYDWSIGYFGSKFLIELRDNKRLLGIRCPECRKVYTPPRKVCGPCFVEMQEMVEVGPGGILEAYSVVNYEFIDPNTGKTRPIPYIYAYIKLDGADNTFCHIVECSDVSLLTVGARVTAIFSDNRSGYPWDIKHFKVMSE